MDKYSPDPRVMNLLSKVPIYLANEGAKAEAQQRFDGAVNGVIDNYIKAITSDINTFDDPLSAFIKMCVVLEHTAEATKERVQLAFAVAMVLLAQERMKNNSDTPS